MTELLLHSYTKRSVNTYLSKPGHALILVGPQGSGKSSLATYIASELLMLSNDELMRYPYIKILSANTKPIGIDSIRNIMQFLSLKVPSQKTIERVVIIEDGHYLTTEAQNAMLKIFEEPPNGTVIILTTTSVQQLLPTIRSRAQLITLKIPEISKLADYLVENGKNADEIKRAIGLSGGLPGLANALLDNQDHPLKEAAVNAKQFLSASPCGRIILADRFSKDKDPLINILYILQYMAYMSLQKTSGQTASRWLHILDTILQTINEVEQNAQPKLSMTKLAMAI